ncbi:MAG TPA: hypothetical protein VKU60_00655 [Chloroflexota bacterium]|nr:hypothetical protein [Chloroflexota bacterium]
MLAGVGATGGPAGWAMAAGGWLAAGSAWACADADAAWEAVSAMFPEPVAAMGLEAGAVIGGCTWGGTAGKDAMPQADKARMVRALIPID